MALTLTFTRPLAAANVTFTVTDQKDQPVADAVVSLVALESAAAPAPSTDVVEIEQKGQEFRPYVTAIQVGTVVRFPNRDDIEHHVYSQSQPRKFELPLYKPGRAETVQFDRPGVVAIGCNIHDWMLAYVVVLPTPWFAVTPGTGSAQVMKVRPGRYRAEVWHPRLGKVETREITLAGDDAETALAFRLALKPDRRIRRRPDASGPTYR